MQASSATHPLPLRARGDDPLDAVLKLGWRASRVGLVLGLVLGLLLHAAALVVPASMLLSMSRYITGLREELREYFTIEYDIDLQKDEEKKAKEPEPEPEPEVPEPQPIAMKAPAPEEDYPYEKPAAAPAEAADALTTEAEDLTGDGWDIVDKDGSDATGGGRTSKKGTSKTPVRDPRARNDGQPGGTGTGPKKPKVDRSRGATLVGGTSWNCPFPPQADLEQVDRAAVLISVTVSPDGTPKGVKVLSDPGYGFGQMAKRCALSRRYTPALDTDGKAITSTTPQIRVTFMR